MCDLPKAPFAGAAEIVVTRHHCLPRNFSILDSRREHCKNKSIHLASDILNMNTIVNNDRPQFC